MCNLSGAFFVYIYTWSVDGGVEIENVIDVVLGETKLVLMIVCKQDNDDSGLDLDLKHNQISLVIYCRSAVEV